MIVLVAVLVAVASASVCFVRLRYAVAPSELDATTLARSLSHDGASAAPVLRLLRGCGEGTFEHEVAGAFDAPRDERAARLNEQLTELDHEVGRWARVPRVCASIASSTSFLLASLLLREGLAQTAGVEEEGAHLVVEALLVRAIGVAAIGVAAAALCIAAHGRARQIAKQRREGADALIERLERLIDAPSLPVAR